MKKKILLLFALVTTLSLFGCSNEKTNELMTNTIEPEITVEPTSEPIVTELPFVYTMPTNELGLVDISIEALQTKVSENSSFYLFIDNQNEIGDKETVNNTIIKLINEYGILCDFYYVDESILVEREVEELHTIFDFLNKENNYGLYAIENGQLKKSYIDVFAVAEDEEYDASKLSKKLISFVYESNLFVNSHGLEVVSYEQVLSKIESGEKFVLYVGRDTCSWCHAFMPSLLTTLENYPANVPVYYFYTQSYKTAINEEKEGAQETWDNVKSSLSITGTPSFLLYENGEQIDAFNGWIEDDYFKVSEEEQQMQRDTTTDMLTQWFADNSLSDACISSCD